MVIISDTHVPAYSRAHHESYQIFSLYGWRFCCQHGINTTEQKLCASNQPNVQCTYTAKGKNHSFSRMPLRIHYVFWGILWWLRMCVCDAGRVKKLQRNRTKTFLRKYSKFGHFFWDIPPFFFPGAGIFLVFVWYLGRIHCHHRCPPTARVNKRALSAARERYVSAIIMHILFANVWPNSLVTWYSPP